MPFIPSIQGLAVGVKNAKENYDATTNAPVSDSTPVPTFTVVVDSSMTGTVNPNAQKAISAILGAVLLMLLLAIVLWFVALYLLVKHWNDLPVWARGLGVIGLIPQVPLGPVITIIVVLAGKNMKK